jgi:hypothetical protein
LQCTAYVSRTPFYIIIVNRIPCAFYFSIANESHHSGFQSSATTGLDSSLNVTKPFYKVEAAVEDWYTKKNISGKVAEYFKDWNKRDVNGETTVGADASVNLTKPFYEAEAAAEDWYTKKNISGKVAEYFKDWNKRNIDNIDNIDGDFPKAINKKNRTEKHDQSTFNYTSPFCLSKSHAPVTYHILLSEIQSGEPTFQHAIPSI